MNGAYFKGWGFMRFWNTKNASAPHGHQNATGEGHGPEYGAAIRADTWRWPHRAMISQLGASSFDAGFFN